MFKGYYQPTAEEVQAIWAEGQIALDANVLLSLYNVQTSTSDLYLSSMKKREGQMWIPYQVALEFHRHVHTERSKQTAAHHSRIKNIDSLLNDFRSTAKKSRLQPSKLQKKAEESLLALRTELDEEKHAIAKQTHHHAQDTLLDRISFLFDGRVGSEPDADALNEMFADGEKRFIESVPPGYEDAKTKSGDNKYGDYVLWRQLMDHAIEQKCDLIFVTDDDKEDWWLKVEKTSVAPRPELIQEFREETGQEVLILNSSQFYHVLVSDGEGPKEDAAVIAAAQEDMEAAVSEAQQLSPMESQLLEAVAQLQASGQYVIGWDDLSPELRRYVFGSDQNGRRRQSAGSQSMKLAWKRLDYERLTRSVAELDRQMRELKGNRESIDQRGKLWIQREKTLEELKEIEAELGRFDDE
ncbi:hypothetical protein CQ020_03845 [Arthrobacter sp. MYb23]|uniref:PIN domain-containing protein n=1 Tax=unclassified Arthrobacter TaxID=235627 RepID=UPI000CFAD941|nr:MULTISPECIES: PIN domain-containing protein [unclassified Arthrobacter]PRB44352.1 hypothetical protein CQ038_03700 [Arthrobacter sp. MYb51]PRB98604.1 hypothetical protein CQ020_03845 [Arthrobacter sp. MYb23]